MGLDRFGCMGGNYTHLSCVVSLVFYYLFFVIRRICFGVFFLLLALHAILLAYSCYLSGFFRVQIY